MGDKTDTEDSSTDLSEEEEEYGKYAVIYKISGR